MSYLQEGEITVMASSLLSGLKPRPLKYLTAFCFEILVPKTLLDLLRLIPTFDCLGIEFFLVVPIILPKEPPTVFCNKELARPNANS